MERNFYSSYEGSLDLQRSVAKYIFSSSWWLDAAAPDAWDEVRVLKGESCVARLRFMVKEFPILGTYLTQPPLTPYLGPEIFCETKNESKKRQIERDITEELINKLPRHNRFQQNFQLNFKNWSAFFQHGFAQHTRYSYCINDLSDLQQIWAGMHTRARTVIRKAIKSHLVVADGSASELYELLKESYKRQDLRPKYSEAYLERIVQAVLEKRQGKVFVVRDTLGCAIAGMLLVWDSESSYYLVGGADTKNRNTGAMSLLLWTALAISSKVTKRFDFEGSMQPGIAKFFESFGAIPEPYFRISKETAVMGFGKKIANLIRAA